MEEFGKSYYLIYNNDINKILRKIEEDLKNDLNYHFDIDGLLEMELIYIINASSIFNIKKADPLKISLMCWSYHYTSNTFFQNIKIARSLTLKRIKVTNGNK